MKNIVQDLLFIIAFASCYILAIEFLPSDYISVLLFILTLSGYYLGKNIGKKARN